MTDNGANNTSNNLSSNINNNTLDPNNGFHITINRPIHMEKLHLNNIPSNTKSNTYTRSLSNSASYSVGLSNLYHHTHLSTTPHVENSQHTPRYSQYPDRSPIPLSVKTIPSETVAMPQWRAKKNITTSSSTNNILSNHIDRTNPSNSKSQATSPPSDSPSPEFSRLIKINNLSIATNNLNRSNDNSKPDVNAVISSNNLVPSESGEGTNSNSLFQPVQVVDKRTSIKHLQSLAVKKLTVENSEVTLQEFLNNSLASLSQVDQAPPLNLRGNDAANILLQFVSETLEIDSSALLIQQVVSPESHGTAKGHSGDAVSLIIDTSKIPPILSAVIKVFSKSKTFESELAALTRMQIWLRGSELNMKNSIVTVPEAIGAHFALVPNDRVGGVLVMNAAQGIPLDDLFVLLGKKQENSPERLAIYQTLLNGVQLTSKAFAILHTCHPNSGGKVKKSYLREYIAQIDNIFEKLELKFKSGQYNDILSIYGNYHIFDLNYLKSRVQPIIDAVLINPGVASVSHGDAHLGNVFYSDEKQLITLIDVPTVNQSVGIRGEPIGSGARDLGNFYHKISQIGHANNLNQNEINTLQQQFLLVYASLCKYSIPHEIFHFFHIRSALGEFHRSIKDHNTNNQKIQYLLDALASADFDRKRSEMKEIHENTANITVRKFNEIGDEDDREDDEIALKIASETKENELKSQREEEKKQLAEIESKKEEEDYAGDIDTLTNDEQQDEQTDKNDEQQHPTTNAHIANDLIHTPKKSMDLSSTEPLALVIGSPIINRVSSYGNNNQTTAGELNNNNIQPISSRRTSIRGIAPNFVNFNSSVNLPESNNINNNNNNNNQNRLGINFNRDESSMGYEFNHERSFSPLPSTLLQGNTTAIPVNYPSHAIPPQSSTSYPLTNINGARVLIVLGADLKDDKTEIPDVFLESRLKQSVSVYYRQVSSISAVILSGGRRPGAENSIAKVMERWLRPFGIRSSSSTFVLYREEMSSDFSEEYPIDLVRQALCIRSLIRCRGMKHGSLIIVCSDFQLASVALVFNRLFHSATGKISLEYIGSPTPRNYAPSASIEAARLKELPTMIKELRLQYPSGYPYIYCPLVDCCRAGSLQQLKLQVEAQGIQMINNDRDNLGLTSLMIASEQGFYDCVEYLIQQGADINARSTLGATSLHYAAARGRLAIVELLLNNGAGASREVRGGCAKPSWIGSKKPYELSRGKQMATTLVMQDEQPTWSVITLLIQPEALTYNEYQTQFFHHARKTSSTYSNFNLLNGSNGNVVNSNVNNNNAISPDMISPKDREVLSPLSPTISRVLSSPTAVNGNANNIGTSSNGTIEEVEEEIIQLNGIPTIVHGTSLNDQVVNTSKQSVLIADSSSQTTNSVPVNATTNTTAVISLAQQKPLNSSTVLTSTHTHTNSNIPASVIVSVPHNLITIRSEKCVFLLRHAESLWNVNGSHRVRGLVDTTLTNSGLKQAKVLGNLLRSTYALQRLGINLIVISPLTRTLQTYMHSVRWYLYPQYNLLEAPIPARGLDKELKQIQNNNNQHNIDEIPVSELKPRNDVRVVVNADLAEQLLSTGTIGRSPEVLREEFPDPSLKFDNLQQIWWYAPERELETVAHGNTATDNNTNTNTNGNTNTSATVDKPAKLVLPLSNTKVYLKKEPIENLYKRISSFKQWLNQQPENRILVIGHGTYFSNMVKPTLTDPSTIQTSTATGNEDAFKTNLFVWRL